MTAPVPATAWRRARLAGGAWRLQHAEAWTRARQAAAPPATTTPPAAPDPLLTSEADRKRHAETLAAQFVPDDDV